MQKYIAKRILFLIPTIIGVTLIIYLIMNITPGDPGRAILGSGVSQADVDAYNHAIGYDLPFFQKFVNYLSNMFLHRTLAFLMLPSKMYSMRYGRGIL